MFVAQRSSAAKNASDFDEPSWSWRGWMKTAIHSESSVANGIYCCQHVNGAAKPLCRHNKLGFCVIHRQQKLKKSYYWAIIFHDLWSWLIVFAFQCFINIFARKQYMFYVRCMRWLRPHSIVQCARNMPDTCARTQICWRLLRCTVVPIDFMAIVWLMRDYGSFQSSSDVLACDRWARCRPQQRQPPIRGEAVWKFTGFVFKLQGLPMALVAYNERGETTTTN